MSGHNDSPQILYLIYVLLMSLVSKPYVPIVLINPIFKLFWYDCSTQHGHFCVPFFFGDTMTWWWHFHFWVFLLTSSDFFVIHQKGFKMSKHILTTSMYKLFSTSPTNWHHDHPKKEKPVMQRSLGAQGRHKNGQTTLETALDKGGTESNCPAAQLPNTHYNTWCQSQKSSSRWTTALIQKLWDINCDCWEHHISIVHAKEHAEVLHKSMAATEGKIHAQDLQGPQHSLGFSNTIIPSLAGPLRISCWLQSFIARSGSRG
jgi:hypothetical protein